MPVVSEYVMPTTRRKISANQEIFLRPVDYVDPRGSVEKIPDGYNWTLDKRVYLDSPADLDYVIGLIEQSYKNVI